MRNRTSVLIAPYAFKGTLSAALAADAVFNALMRLAPEVECHRLPLGDGGSGTLDALVQGMGGEIHRHNCISATGVEIDCRWGLMPDGQGVIEAAECIALADVPDRQRHPGHLTTRGIGELILEAVNVGARSLVVGLGDTATHDCGLGMASALGFRFLDASGNQLEPVGASLPRLARIDATSVVAVLAGLRVVALCDVMNPLLGPDGAALRFAEQKGADHEMAEILEHGSERFAEVVERDLGISLTGHAGAGAAGGLGAGLVAFLGAELRSGSNAVLDAVGFDAVLKRCDLVVTGEGRIDRKTLLGKGVARVARRAADAGVRCIVIVGSTEGNREEFERELRATIIELNDTEPTSGSAVRAIAEAIALTIIG